MKTHNLFISHSWIYSDSYGKPGGLLDARPYFSYRNYSNPKDDPIHNARSVTTLKAAIQRRMSPCGVALILAGVYATCSTVHILVHCNSLVSPAQRRKFAALHKLEEKLVYPFFKHEWEFLEEKRKLSRYWKPTIVETGLPIIFLLLSTTLIGISFC